MSITLSKRWAIVLVASLAINLFLVGGIAAGLAMRGAAEPSATPAETASVRPNLRGLPSFSMPFAIRTLGPEVRPMAREIFRTRRPDFRKKRRAIGQANREAVRLLSAAEFDAAAFRKALGVVRVNGVGAQEANHESVVKPCRPTEPRATTAIRGGNPDPRGTPHRGAAQPAQKVRPRRQIASSRAMPLSGRKIYYEEFHR